MPLKTQVTVLSPLGTRAFRPPKSRPRWPRFQAKAGGGERLQTLVAQRYGFTLFEVLVTLLVIAVGLLGNAGIMAVSINNTANARNRSMAAMEASGLASMMHANTAYWQLGSPTNNCSVSCTASGSTTTSCTTGGTSGFITLSDAILSNQSASCTSMSCSGLQMASYDLQNWGVSVASALPNGTGLVACNTSTAPILCSISISWTQQNLALNRVTGTETGILASAKSVSNTYSMVVQP